MTPTHSLVSHQGLYPFRKNRRTTITVSTNAESAVNAPAISAVLNDSSAYKQANGSPHSTWKVLCAQHVMSFEFMILFSSPDSSPTAASLAGSLFLLPARATTCASGHFFPPEPLATQ